MIAYEIYDNKDRLIETVYTRSKATRLISSLGAGAYWVTRAI